MFAVGQKSADANAMSAFPPVSDKTADIPGGPFRADIVAKVENRTTLKIARKSNFRLLCSCFGFNATTEVHGRFWMERYGPSRRRAQNAPAALRIFLRHPKKTFATISTQSGP